MKPERLNRIHRLRHGLLIAAVVVVLATAILAFFAPAGLDAALRFGLSVCLAPALGSLLFALIHRLTGGAWGETLRPFLSAGAGLVPWIWLLALPVVALSGHESAPAWPAYESRGMVVTRALLYTIVLAGVAGALHRRDRNSAAWIGPAGLIVTVFLLHLLAEDWLATLEPHWHSTAFPLVWMSGLAVAGLALAVLAGLACGIAPGPTRESGDAPGLDWGNLLLAATLFWCYVAFAQFLIIWAGNVPREISWFERRTHGVWAWVPLILAVIHFLLPLTLLLSRPAKRSAGLLALVAGTLLTAQAIYAAWMILPAFPVSGLAAAALPVLVLTGIVALFAYLYLTFALRAFEPS